MNDLIIPVCIRRIVIVLLAVIIGALFVSAAYSQGRASVSVSPVNDAPSPVVLIIDGKVVSVDSLQFMRGQQVMIWIRDLETLGWGKASPGELGEVIFKGNNITLTFKKGEGIAKVMKQSLKLPVDTYVSDGKLMVPLSFVAKSLGFDCEIAYKPVASITTGMVRALESCSNTLQGRVIFGDRGIAGITVRAVDKDFNVIEGAVATTGPDGSYTIGNLPAGEFAAYIYTGDNPKYFNRTTEFVVVRECETAHLKPIELGKILAPKRPEPGNRARPVDGWIALEWAKCEGAASYEVTISKKGTEEPLVTITSKEPKARVASDKLKPGTAYEVQVSALDAKGNFLGGTVGAGGSPWYFTFE